MANYALSATQAIVDYLWTNLTTTNSNIKSDPNDNSGKILSPSYQIDTNGPLLDIIPIFPAQQDMINYQELGTKTHIVYDWVADGYEDNWLICRDSMMFTIYSQDFNKIAEIQSLMLDLFRRMDESARDINASLPSGSPFIFFSVSLADLLSPEPQREKNGWFAGQVVIRYKYGRQVNSSGRFA
jgi:hypothetical protein